jgi:hypothetical protein
MAELYGDPGTVGPTRSMSETGGECGHDIRGFDAARDCRAEDLVTPSRWGNATAWGGEKPDED